MSNEKNEKEVKRSNTVQSLLNDQADHFSKLFAKSKTVNRSTEKNATTKKVEFLQKGSNLEIKMIYNSYGQCVIQVHTKLNHERGAIFFRIGQKMGDRELNYNENLYIAFRYLSLDADMKKSLLRFIHDDPFLSDFYQKMEPFFSLPAVDEPLNALGIERK